jgi:hypothetical protein
MLWRATSLTICMNGIFGRYLSDGRSILSKVNHGLSWRRFGEEIQTHTIATPAV